MDTNATLANWLHIRQKSFLAISCKKKKCLYGKQRNGKKRQTSAGGGGGPVTNLLRGYVTS